MSQHVDPTEGDSDDAFASDEDAAKLELIRELDEKLARAIAPGRLRYHRMLFRKSKNPIHAWEAFRTAREHGLAIPEWVLEYLDDSANRIGQLAADLTFSQPARTFDEATSRKKTPSRARARASPVPRSRARAGLRSGGWSTGCRSRRIRKDAFEIGTLRTALHRTILEDDLTLDKAAHSLASETGFDRETIKSAYNKYASLISRPLADM